MIGIKIKNSFWEKALLDLLDKKAEVWNSQKKYLAVITDLKGAELKNFQNQENAPLIGLGTKKLQWNLSLPCSKKSLENVLHHISPFYENKTFLWDSQHRQLEYKKNKKKISLTEKESSIVDFLRHAPGQEATKEELLLHVWGYTKETETHTVETTLYDLRQKIGASSVELIVSTKTGYRLI